MLGLARRGPRPQPAGGSSQSQAQGSSSWGATRSSESGCGVAPRECSPEGRAERLRPGCGTGRRSSELAPCRGREAGPGPWRPAVRAALPSPSAGALRLSGQAQTQVWIPMFQLAESGHSRGAVEQTGRVGLCTPARARASPTPASGRQHEKNADPGRATLCTAELPDVGTTFHSDYGGIQRGPGAPMSPGPQRPLP